MKKSSTDTGIVIKTEIVCPNDANPMGILQGGKLVQWMDIAAAVCAQTHAKNICVTASINEISFKSSAKVGDFVTLKAKITRVFNTSMEIKVEAFTKSIKANKSLLISSSYFIFVAIDEQKHPVKINPIIPKTKTELEDYSKALKRKNNLKLNGNYRNR